MKVCLLCYDALEYELVEKFDLENLKQKEYGKTNISDFEKNHTKILWPSILSGENLEEEFTKTESSIWADIFRKPFYFVREYFPSLAVSIRENFVMRQDVTGTIVNKRISLSRTFFNLADSYKAIDIPSFNRRDNSGINMKLKDKVKGEIPDEDFWNEAVKCFKNQKEKVFEEPFDEELSAFYLGFADVVGHIWRSDIDRMERAYKMLDDLTAEVKERFDGIVIVLSDHGMEDVGGFGNHATMDYAFYSSNVPLDLTNPKITDFYDIVGDLLNDTYKSEKYNREEKKLKKREQEVEDGEEMEERLRELGYFGEERNK